MRQAKNESKIEQNTNPQLDRRIKNFTSKLRKEFAADIAQNLSTFRSRVIGKIRAGLPRQRPGRQGSPVVRKAAEIYESDYKSKGNEGNWHQIAKQVYTDYADLTAEFQRFRRYQLRSGVHSHLYEERSRKRRKSKIRGQAVWDRGCEPPAIGA
jgi:hypothetical protein